MKKIVLSVSAMVAMSTLSFAGGDIDPVEPMVGETAVMAGPSHSGGYVGLGFSVVGTGNDSINVFSDEAGQDRSADIVFQAGYEFNPYIAVEGRYSTSISKGDILERDTWGIFVKPQYPVGEGVNIYALLGYGGMTLDGVDGANVDLDDDGFQWGVGLSYDMTTNVALFVDYVMAANDMEADAYPLAGSNEISSAALTLGVTYKF